MTADAQAALVNEVTDAGADTLRSRRQLLTAGASFAAAGLAFFLGSVTNTSAANGDSVISGATNNSDAPTTVINATDGEPSLAGGHAGAGVGVTGDSARGTGVRGTVGLDPGQPIGNTAGTGVYGNSTSELSPTGVWGEAPSGTGVMGTGETGIAGFGDKGVYGSGTIGVMGDTNAAGVGLYGYAGDGPAPVPASTAAILARSGRTEAVALDVVGRVRFSRSGRLRFAADRVSRTVQLPGVSPSSYVIATMQTSVPGVYVRAATCGAGSFTIRLSKAAGRTAYVGYLVIN